MKITPMVRNNIFLNAHPVGCAEEVRAQIERTAALRAKVDAEKSSRPFGPRNALVIGSSTGYGLASRITAAFAYGAKTVGFSFEREPSASKTASPGWYANRSFDQEAAARGLYAKTFNMDAFSSEAKAAAIEAARAGGFSYDLVVYSLASPVRSDPETGIMYRSVIKPIGQDYSGKTVDVFSGKISEARAVAADEKEIAETVKVMGGEDWRLWIDALAKAGVLARGALTLAYSYIGPPLSWPIYKDGTIGRAKAHLEKTAGALRADYADIGLGAYVSINKAVVTRASAVIPIIPLYVSTLFKVMKARNVHEDCLDQMLRLFSQGLYARRADTGGADARADAGAGAPSLLDSEKRIRLDDREMEAAVQKEVAARLKKLDETNLSRLADIEGFRDDFLRVHGFNVPGVDYEAEVSPL